MSNLVGRNGERVKLKIFALLIAFQFNCFRGEEDHLKRRSSSSPPPQLSLAWATSINQNYKRSARERNGTAKNLSFGKQIFKKTKAERNSSSVSLRLPPSPAGEGSVQMFILTTNKVFTSRLGHIWKTKTFVLQKAFSCGRRGTA